MKEIIHMRAFIIKATRYFIMTMVCIFGYWTYSAFFAESTYNYFSMKNFENALLASGCVGILFAARSGKKQKAARYSKKNVNLLAKEAPLIQQRLVS